MSSRFSRIWTPPVFEDEEKTRVGRLLNVILFGTLVVTLAVIAFQPLLSPDPVPRLIFIGLFALLETGGLIAIRKGHVRPIAQILPAALWLLLTAVTFYAGGVQTTSFVSYIVVIVIASLLGGGRIGIGYAALSVLAGLGFLLGELNGQLPPVFISTTSVSFWVGLTANFLITALLLHLATRSLTETLDRARRNKADLLERNTQLHAQTEMLENREEALRISEARLRLAMEAANVGTWEWDLSNNRISWSENIESILGLTGGPYERTFEAYLALVSPEERAPVRAAVAGLLSTAQDGGRFIHEHRVINPGGDVLLVEVKGALYCDPEGTPARMVGTVLDISDRMQAEEERKKSHQRLSQALKAARAGAWEWDISSNQAYWSEENYEILGLPAGASEANYLLWRECVHPDDREVAERQISEVLETRSDLNIEFRVIRPDGSIRWIQDVGKLILDDTGEPIQMFGIQMDITERKRAEEALQRGADRLKTLHAIDRAILAADSVEEIIQAALDNLHRLIPGERISATLFDFENETLQIIESAKEAGSHIQSGARHALDPRLPIGLMRKGQIVDLTEIARSGSPLRDLAVWRDSTFKSGFITPILSRDTLIGTINLASRMPDTFSPEHHEIAQEVANSLGVALQSAQLVSSLQRYSAQLETLRQASLKLTSDLDLQPVLSGVLECALALTSADDAHIFLYDESRGHLTFGAAHWAGGRQEKPYAELRPEGLTYTVARSGDRIVVPEVNNHPLFKDWPWGGAIIGLPLCHGEQVNGVMTVAFDKPHAFTEDEIRVLELLADQAAIAIQNAQLFTSEHRQTLQLEALHQIALALSAELDLDSLLLIIVQRAIALLDGVSGGLYLHEPGEDVLVWRVLSGNGLVPTGTSLKKGQGLSGRVWETGQVINIPDYSQWDGRHQPYEGYRWRSVIGVPVSRGDQLFGVLNILADQPAAFSDSDANLLSLFATQAAIAIENARLFQSVTEQGAQLRDLTAQLATLEEEERKQLARELHDRVGQNLTALSITLSTAKSLLPAETTGVLRPWLDEAQRLVDETAQQIRDVMADLRPPVLDDYGLLAALRWHCDRFAVRTGIEVHLEGQEHSPRLPLAAETALFRIAQEALNNISRHAEARSVHVSLSDTPADVQLLIADEGAGFDPHVLESNTGWGLRIMRERAESVEGVLTVESTPGAGTRILVRLPRSTIANDSKIGHR